MADTDVITRPTTAPLATLATITVYERLVAEKEAEIAALRAEIEHLGRHLHPQQLSLRQAQALIAHLSERAAEERAAVPRRPAAAWSCDAAPAGPGRRWPWVRHRCWRR